jgi:hypothetical protein
MARLFRVARFFGAFSPSKLAAQHAITRGTPEFDKLIDARDRIASRFSVDLSAYGIRRPAQGPLAETFRKGRIPTFDVGAIPKIRSGAIRVIDGNLRPLECLEEDGVRLGGTLERVDDVVLATGFEPRLQEFLADDDLLGVLPGFGVGLLPLTDGRSRSRIRPSIFFPGFDLTPLGGVSLGRWGWEAGERIADELAASRSAGNAAQKEARTASPALTAALTMR